MDYLLFYLGEKLEANLWKKRPPFIFFLLVHWFDLGIQGAKRHKKASTIVRMHTSRIKAPPTCICLININGKVILQLEHIA